MEAALTALRDALGADCLSPPDPEHVDGVPLAASWVPRDGDELARGLRTLTQHGLGAVVHGGGSRLDLGNLPEAGCIGLSMRGLRGIDTLDGEEGVAHIRAGTRLREIEAALDGSGWELPLDPPGDDATLGGTLASAALGPRHLGLGRPRDVTLGLEVTLGDGTRTRCGGRVVKNVTGYDLMKLQIGALGTLGVIEAAWVRLRARPDAAQVWSTASREVRTLAERGIEASSLASARALAVISAAWARRIEPSCDDSALLVAELAGAGAAVAQDAGRLEERSGARPAQPEALAAIRRLQGRAEARALRFRFGVRVSRLARLLAALEAEGAAWLAYPGTGLCFAELAPCEETDVAAAWDRAFRVARPVDAALRLESGPPHAKTGRDVFGVSPPPLDVMRALKQRFDPARVLNPGRFVGGL